jgi:hypothetical protein
VVLQLKSIQKANNSSNLFIILIICASCKNDYENEEIKALTDITNDYLKRSHLNLQKEYLKLDTLQIDNSELDFDVYISDALIPIKQIISIIHLRKLFLDILKKMVQK